MHDDSSSDDDGDDGARAPAASAADAAAAAADAAAFRELYLGIVTEACGEELDGIRRDEQLDPRGLASLIDALEFGAETFDATDASLALGRLRPPWRRPTTMTTTTRTPATTTMRRRMDRHCSARRASFAQWEIDARRAAGELASYSSRF